MVKTSIGWRSAWPDGCDTLRASTREGDPSMLGTRSHRALGRSLTKQAMILPASFPGCLGCARFSARTYQKMWHCKPALLGMSANSSIMVHGRLLELL